MTKNVSKQYEKSMHDHYTKLLGHRIVDYFLDSSDPDVEPFPILVTSYKDKLYNVIIQRDPEGNGGGFVNINEISFWGN